MLELTFILAGVISLSIFSMSSSVLLSVFLDFGVPPYIPCSFFVLWPAGTSSAVLSSTVPPSTECLSQLLLGAPPPAAVTSVADSMVRASSASCGCDVGDRSSSSGLCCLAQSFKALQRWPAAFTCLPGFLSVPTFVMKKEVPSPLERKASTASSS